MMRALWTAASGMVAQQANIDNISNNLANVNTTGFKKSCIDFQDLMYQTITQAGASTGTDTQLPTGIQMGHGVREAATEKMYTEGSMQNTGNPLDMAIEGDGFFKVLMPDGTAAYTRDGSFKNDSTGRVVTSDGYPLDPAVTLPAGATNITISAEGAVSVTVPSSTTPQPAGQIMLSRFTNSAGLSNIGRNLLTETAASGAPVDSTPGDGGTGTIASQYLENSNVQVVDEMVNMIIAQRAYEMNSKAVQTCDEMLSTANGLKR